VGTLAGGQRHDMFVYRTFFDLEVTHENGQGLFTTRNKQGTRGMRGGGCARCVAHAHAARVQTPSLTL
jgi:hypothetical protein